MGYFHFNFPNIFWHPALVVILTLGSVTAHADFVRFPATRHHLYMTNALISEEGFYVVARDEGRVLGAVGASAAMGEFSWRDATVQIVGFGTVHTALRTKDLKTETLDADLGVAFEVRETAAFRWSASLVHTSGHAVDGVEFPVLLAPNLGLDSLWVRAIYDAGHRFRLGATVKLHIDADPGYKRLAGQQFVEYYPFGEESEPKDGRLFVSLGLEEYGVAQWNLGITAQTGISFGSHFTSDHTPQIRLALGIYSGPDPRMKYYAFLNRTVTFPFLGLFFRV